MPKEERRNGECKMRPRIGQFAQKAAVKSYRNVTNLLQAGEFV